MIRVNRLSYGGGRLSQVSVVTLYAFAMFRESVRISKSGSVDRC